MSNYPRVIPTAPGYVARYDLGELGNDSPATRPVVAIGMENAREGFALVFNYRGELVSAVSEDGLPGTFTGVIPSSWVEGPEVRATVSEDKVQEALSELVWLSEQAKTFAALASLMKATPHKNARGYAAAA